MPHEDINFISARDAVIVANDEWLDDETNDLTFSGDLGPGDEEVVARVESREPDVAVAARAVAATTHPHDFDNDGVEESAIRYRYEHKLDKSGGYRSLPGLRTTLPLGDIGEPVELVTGAYVGPVAGFQIVFENRTDGSANPVTIDQDNIGGELHCRILREHADMAMPTVPAGAQTGGGN
jgi:hypothetical protein